MKIAAATHTLVMLKAVFLRKIEFKNKEFNRLVSSLIIECRNLYLTMKLINLKEINTMFNLKIYSAQTMKTLSLSKT